MDKLKEFIPNFLIQTSILCGVFPLKSNSPNNVFFIYSVVLLIATLLTFTLMTFYTSCLTCQLNTKKITFSIWFHILKVVYPTLRIFSSVPSYYTAIFLLKKYLFNIIYNICISDSILKNTNQDIKKKHFFLVYLFSIFTLLPSTLLKLNILYSALCSVLMKGDVWRMGFFINIYLGDTSMTCAELQFICFCSCLGYRYKWINETLDCIMKHIDSELQNTYSKQSKDVIKNCLLHNYSKKISLHLNMKKNLLKFFEKFVHKKSTLNMSLHKTYKNGLQSKRCLQNRVITSKNKFLRSVKSRNVNVLNYTSGSDEGIEENYHKFNLEADYIFKSVQIRKLKNIGKLSSKISQLRAAHRFLHKAAFLLEILYRTLITSSVITLFALALLYAYFELLHFDQHGLSYVQYSRYLVFVWIFHFIGRIYLILTQSHYAAQEATYTASLLTQIDCRQLDPDSRFEVGINYLKLKLFLNDIRSKELSFSMWGFFSLTPNLITIVVSAVTTYLAILVQFSEKK